MTAQTLDDLFSELEAAERERRRPPVARWQPTREGVIDIRIAADGTWYHEGTAFQRPALVRLLSSVLRRDGDAYFLVSPQEKLRIDVADVPLLALDFEYRGEGDSTDILFTTNGGDYVTVDAEHAITLRGDRPYLHVRDGLEALIVRSAFYRLLDLGEDVGGAIRLYSRGQAFDLPY